MDPGATCHDELVDALRARRDVLGLSNAFIEEICGMAAGHCDQIMGPTRKKNLTKFTIDLFMKVLAVKVIIVADVEQEKRMAHRWETRAGNRVRANSNRISKQIMERAKPHIRRDFALRGVAARMDMLTSEHRSKIATKAAKARWRKPRIVEITAV